jgi:hypothetical protein
VSTRSDEFRVRWAAHNVRIHTTGVRLIPHPLVGDLELPFESLPLPAEPGQSLLVYTAEPESSSQDALNLLASWTSTTDDNKGPPTTEDSTQAESFQPPTEPTTIHSHNPTSADRDPTISTPSTP